MNNSQEGNLITVILNLSIFFHVKTCQRTAATCKWTVVLVYQGFCNGSLLQPMYNLNHIFAMELLLILLTNTMQ